MWILVPVVCSAPVALVAPFSAQHPRAARAAVERAPAQRAVLPGRVLTVEGWPAAGVIVTSSAGGTTVTGADGAFALEFELPTGARALHVTASDPAGAASAEVVVDTSGPLDAGDLQLIPGNSGCTRGWTPTFGAAPGVDFTVEAMVAFDDGRGPALFCAGMFSHAGNQVANGVARWDGQRWSTLGTGLQSVAWDKVHALLVHDDGGGTALYAGGGFTIAGGAPAARVARWDGTSWSALGSGTDASVFALAEFDDGTGPALFAGGSFTTAGGAAASRVARWDGASWSALGSGTDGQVESLAVFDDGGGPALYAGGWFTNASAPAAHIARWDGSSWSSLGTGTNDTVFALAVFDDGSGPALFAGGSFTTAGGVAAAHVARWDGASWSALGSGTDGAVETFFTFDDGGGPALYAGGTFTSAGGVATRSLARWDGVAWSASGAAVSRIEALAVFDDGSGSGPALFAGGAATPPWEFLCVAKRVGASWAGLGSGANGAVAALEVFDDGSGSALYAGGGLALAGGVAVNGIARWDGARWSALGTGMTAPVEALKVFDDGGGPALYAGGRFPIAGAVLVHGCAKWDGSAWSGVGGGTDAAIRCFEVFDDGTGPVLVAGGTFHAAGGAPAEHVARWNGAAWSRLGTGVGGIVNALTVFDDGNGPALYAAGYDTGVKRWNGPGWSTLGGGGGGLAGSDDVFALAVFDDGSGPALYAGGNITRAGAVDAFRIAKWDGTSWSQVGAAGPSNGLNGPVLALRVLQSGNRPALHVGGYFSLAGGVAVNNLAVWNGTTWSPLGSGMDSDVLVLQAFDDGNHAFPLVVAGGRFFDCFDSGDSFIAAWRDCMRVRER